LILAGGSTPGSPLPVAFSNGAQAPNGSQRGAKGAKQQPKAEDQGPIAASMTTPQPATSAFPLWIGSFSWDMAGHPQTTPMQSPDGRTTDADALPGTANPLAPEGRQPAPGDANGATPAVPVMADNGASAASDGQALEIQAVPSPPETAPSAPQPTKAGDQRSTAMNVAAARPAASALPLWAPSFAQAADSHTQPVRMQSSWNDAGRQPSAASATREGELPAGSPAAAQAVGAAARGQAETSQSARFLAAAAGSLPVTSKPSAPTGELAFAARVQPDAPASSMTPVPPQPPQHDMAAPAQAFSKKTVENDAAETTVVAPITAGAGASLASYGQGAESQPDTPLPAAPSGSAPPSPIEDKWIPQTQPKPAAAPVNDISLQVTQPGAQKVEVRVVQQSGELRVAVRTGDADLAHGLQQGLSDLVGRLQETGLRAEAWHPGGTTVQSTPVVESRTSPSGSQHGDSQGHSGGSRQQEGERRQSQSQRPGWVEELDNSFASGEQSQGASYGIGS
jgi:hypothetical protein